MIALGPRPPSRAERSANMPQPAPPGATGEEKTFLDAFYDYQAGVVDGAYGKFLREDDADSVIDFDGIVRGRGPVGVRSEPTATDIIQDWAAMKQVDVHAIEEEVLREVLRDYAQRTQEESSLCS